MESPRRLTGDTPLKVTVRDREVEMKSKDPVRVVPFHGLEFWIKKTK